MDNDIKINCEAVGFEEAQAKVEALADAYAGFPPQVTIRDCKYCTFNIYPSQTRFVDDGKGADNAD